MRIAGEVAPGFERVAEEFEHNFSERGEIGASFSAIVDGVFVADLWGGLADLETNRPWQRDTLQLVFSGAKGFVAVCLLVLLDRGALDLDKPVHHYWPEFARGGKQDLLVRHIVSHQTGLPAIAPPVPLEEIVDDTRMAALLARQKPFWSPGERLAYHGLTFGWLCGELIRRIDGRSVGRFFADEVAEPLGLELWIGLPPELEPRVSTLIDTRPPLTDPEFSEAARAKDPVLDAIVAGRPGVFRRDPSPWNSTAFRCAEIPAANAIGTARSIAKLYGCLARDGELDGVRLLTPGAVALGRRCLVRGVDAFNGVEFAYGVGFLLQNEQFDQGPPASAFGHAGAGGSVHSAWPSYKTGFSYAMNDMREDFSRAAPLLRALHEALASDGDVRRS